MIVGGVVNSIRLKREKWLLDGYLVHDGSPDSAIAVLRLGGRVLAQTLASGDGVRLRFRFVLAGNLSFLMAPGAPLDVASGAVRAAFSDEATASRRAFSDDEAGLERVLRKLDAGQGLTKRGSLMRPVRDRGRMLPVTLAHYLTCDAMLREVSGYDIHVVGGTMLGLLRDGGPISHDIDFDGAYLSRFRDPLEVKREFIKIVRALVERGEDVQVSQWERGRNFAKWYTRPADRPGVKARHIDLFPAYIDADGFYCRPTFVRIPGGREMILPLRKMSFDGVGVWAAARIEEKTVRVFGDDWRVPDVFWRKPRLPGARAALAPLQLSLDELDETGRFHARFASLRAEGAAKRKLRAALRRFAGLFGR